MIDNLDALGVTKNRRALMKKKKIGKTGIDGRKRDERIEMRIIRGTDVEKADLI